MNKKGFTLVEMVTALAVLVIIIGFSSVIFKSSIDAYRVASAESEIMQKLRAITDTLNRDFEGFVTDGYLRIVTNTQPRKETKDSANPTDVNMCRIYFFTTGDFQSWYNPGIRSNVARIFWGHDSASLDTTSTIVQNKFNLVRDVNLLTPGQAEIFPRDWSQISLSQILQIITQDSNNLRDPPNSICKDSFPLNIHAPLPIDNNDVRRLMCENIGEFKIEWWDYSLTPPGWNYIENGIGTWNISDTKPRALKFTFTLYDSKGIIKGGRHFSHIVYLGN